MSTRDDTRRRERVERGIYKRSGRYQVAVTKGDGRVTFKTCRTLTEARAIRGDILARRARGESVAPPPRLTLSEAIESYFTQARLRPGTAAQPRPGRGEAASPAQARPGYDG
jgi:hypothetical protein